jgi:hypothetical protein
MHWFKTAPAAQSHKPKGWRKTLQKTLLPVIAAVAGLQTIATSVTATPTEGQFKQPHAPSKTFLFRAGEEPIKLTKPINTRQLATCLNMMGPGTEAYNQRMADGYTPANAITHLAQQLRYCSGSSKTASTSLFKPLVQQKLLQEQPVLQKKLQQQLWQTIDPIYVAPPKYPPSLLKI